jgi:hypothetical protein
MINNLISKYLQYYEICEISGSHGSKYEDDSILRSISKRLHSTTSQKTAIFSTNFARPSPFIQRSSSRNATVSNLNIQTKVINKFNLSKLLSLYSKKRIMNYISV